MNKKISVNLALAIAIIAMTVTFSVTMVLSQNLFDKTVSKVREKEIMYQKIAEIDKTVRANYYGEINDVTLYDMMGAGFLQGIGDSSAKYYTAKRYVDYLAEQNGTLTSIGVEVVKEGNYARVIRVYKDSPAEEAGIKRNCMITKIGESETKNLSVESINALLRGEAGTTVTIEYISEIAETMPAIEIQRKQYDTPSVDTFKAEGKTAGYIKISTFNASTEAELRIALENLKATGLDSVVFDLRNNNGGTLQKALDCIDLLCPVGAMANVRNKDGTIDVLDMSDINEETIPMVVLVNGSTSAGAEIFASAIRDFGKGKIVGTNTAGKGAILCTPVRLTDGSAISYTIGMMLTKGEAEFNGFGIAPDMEAILRPEDEKNFYDLTPETDPQIAKAFDVLQSLITKIEVNNGTSGEENTSSVPETKEE